MPEKYAIGVDLGGTNLRAALVAKDGRILKKVKEPSRGDAVASLRKAIDEVMDSRAAGVGIGAAGLIDREALAILSSPNLPSLNGWSFRELGLEVPLVVENDANAAALGERWMGAGKEFRSFVYMTLGTGVGGAVVHNGKLLDIAAEVGHMSIAFSGERCPCGNYGCLENYASARAIVHAAAKAVEGGSPSILREKGNIYKMGVEEIYRAASDGDVLSREVLKEGGKYLGVGIANLVNLLSPEAVILTGGLTGAWDIFVEEAIREASRRAFKRLFEGLKVIPSALGDEAGLLGAASLVLHERKSAVS